MGKSVDIFEYACSCAAKIHGKIGNREKTPVPTSPVSEKPAFGFVEATPDAYEGDIEFWARERCIFRDGCSSGLGALHSDYAEWCDKVGREVPVSFRIFKRLLQDSRFAITDDGRVSGLILIEDVRALRKQVLS
jgi:hypothetical protein